MTPEEMNEGVRILIERMDTHPEEFNYGIHEKWSDIITEILKHGRGQPSTVPFLHPEEVQAVQDKLQKLERDEFTAEVLRRLAAGTSRDDVDLMMEKQLNLPYARAMTTVPRRFVLNKSQLANAATLGVSPEVYAEAIGKTR